MCMGEEGGDIDLTICCTWHCFDVVSIARDVNNTGRRWKQQLLPEDFS